MKNLIGQYLSSTISRRNIIQGMVALGFSSSASHSLLGSVEQLSEDETMVTDHQSHWFSPTALDRLCDKQGEYPRAELLDDGTYLYQPVPGVRVPLSASFTDLNIQLKDMDQYGIDLAVISPASFPGIGDVSMLELPDAIETAKIVNLAQGQAQKRYPGRFAALAVLPLQDAPAALSVLDEAVADHGLVGVSVPPTIDGEPLFSKASQPIFKRIEELNLPVIMHPGFQTAMRSVYGRYSEEPDNEFAWGYAVEIYANWMFDTSAAALGLIYSGALDACPGLSVLHPHVGGAIPYIIGRIASHDAHKTPGDKENRPLNSAPALDYLRTRFFIDTVTLLPAALRLAVDTYGINRVLFATDYPFHKRSEGFQILDQALTPDEVKTVKSQNIFMMRSAQT